MMEGLVFFLVVLQMLKLLVVAEVLEPLE